MPKKRANAIALLELLEEPQAIADGNPWLEDPLPLAEFCRQYLDVTPWDTQQHDLSQFLGTTAADAKALFTQEPPTPYNCGILCYGKGCLGPRDRITDQASGITRTMAEWAALGEPLLVKSWDGQQVVLAEASPVYCKGEDTLYQVTLVDGRQFTATADHRCLSDGGWLPISQCRDKTLLTDTGYVWVKAVTGAGRSPYRNLTLPYYDLTVQETGCYFDDQGILHHNSGKDTLASVCLVWFAHVLLCMRDPQAFLGLAPQEPIDIALASPTLRQTRRVTFTKLKNRLRTCTWLRSHLERPEFGISDVDRCIKKATDAADFIELPHNIRIHNLPLLSSSAEGFNLLAFVISEFAGLESEAQGATAEALFNTFVTSCRTRFRKAWKGFLTSFPRSISDPQEQLIEAHQEGRFPELFVVRRPTWEVVPHLEYKDFETEFIRDPEGSAAKLAAQPRAATEAYFRSPDLIIRHASGGTPELLRRYEIASDGHPDPILERDLFGDVVLDGYGFPVLASWVKGKPDREYYIHIDLGLSGDSAGFAMAHLEPVGDRDDRLIPVVDLSFRWKAAHFANVGQLQRYNWDGGKEMAVNIRQAEIDLQTPVEFVLYLSKRLGFTIALVTFDQFNSATARQSLYHYGVTSQNFSVDRNPGYYDELKALIYGRQLIYRIDPILFGELRKLVRLSTGKIDAPRTSLGSDVDSHKDIADAVAAVVGRLSKLSAASGEFYTLPEPELFQEAPKEEQGAVDLAADYSPTQTEIMREFFS